MIQNIISFIQTEKQKKAIHNKRLDSILKSSYNYAYNYDKNAKILGKGLMLDY